MLENLYPLPLIKYVYDELSPEENLLWEERIFEDEALEQQFFELLYIKRNLEEAERQPRESSIDRIFAFSRNFDATSSVA